MSRHLVPARYFGRGQPSFFKIDCGVRVTLVNNAAFDACPNIHAERHAKLTQPHAEHVLDDGKKGSAPTMRPPRIAAFYCNCRGIRSIRNPIRNRQWVLAHAGNVAIFNNVSNRLVRSAVNLCSASLHLGKTRLQPRQAYAAQMTGVTPS
jgi:hypothetical protein